MSSRVRLLAACAASLLIAAPATASVSSYVAAGAFDAASDGIAFSDFETETPGYAGNPLESGGSRFTQLPGGDPNIVPYIGSIGAAGTAPEAFSQVPEANVDENFRIELAAGGSFNAIDNISLGTLVGVPEPAGWALLVAGFGLLGAAMRRRRTIPVVVA